VYSKGFILDRLNQAAATSRLKKQKTSLPTYFRKSLLHISDNPFYQKDASAHSSTLPGLLFSPF
jgi:hypothetical protein